MKRLIPLAVLFVLFVGLSFSGSSALYDHPAQPGHMLEKSARAALGAYVYGIPRPDFYYTVAERRSAIIAASWVSLREGHIVLSKPTGRWHRAGAWRRVQ